jgi:two-component system, NarL family, sensor histidine kinase UhpB
MAGSQLQIDLVMVFFIYGLAFFSMGIALAIESTRSPLLAERRIIRPLAVFGLLHGMHEWFEIILLQGVWLGMPFPAEISWVRSGLLAISFVPLIIFGLLMLFPQKGQKVAIGIVGALLVILTSLVMINVQMGADNIFGRMDALSRYLLAVPGGILAALALNKRAKLQQNEQRPRVTMHFNLAAIGFGVYGSTQIFASQVDMFPTIYLNAELFSSLVGFPIQVVRAGMALVITISMVRLIQFAEREREGQLVAAQRARVEALEQVKQELVEREELRRQLLRHTVIAQEAERSRIARELHDETSQALTAFTLNLATLEKSMQVSLEVEQLIKRLQDLSQQMSQSIYRMVHDLRPAQLDDLGLVPALRYLIDEARNRLGLEVTLSVNGTRQRLDPLVETVIFRVAQEGITNISRHARTSWALIEVSFNPQEIILEIVDHGKGFNVNEDLSPPRGWGLEGMRERAESLGGSFQIQSTPGHGTAVKVVIPLPVLQPS